MSKSYRAWDVDQGWLLPASVHQFVPPGHLAHFVRDTVREGLDLSAITGVYKAAQGQPPYHPGMLVALLYCMVIAAASIPAANLLVLARSGST